MKIFKILNPFRIFFITILFLFLILAGILAYMFSGEVEPADEIEYGVTFSQYFAEQMGFNWHQGYEAILDELEVKKLRLVAYWPMIEKEKNRYDFTDLDWQIEQAAQRGAEITLVVGEKVPRWPECHIPKWVHGMTSAEKKEKLLQFIEQVILHYRDNQAIKIWQVENEPFLKDFGECAELDEYFLEKEVKLVRSLDTHFRPIQLTASGELSSWTKPAALADILGTTLYRIVWNDYIGYFKYPIPPVFYHKRAELVKKITGVEKVLICELQLEPWAPRQIYEIDEIRESRSMDIERFREIIEYTKQTGFDEVYLWGVEWWYSRYINGNDVFWEEAKKLFID